MIRLDSADAVSVRHRRPVVPSDRPALGKGQGVDHLLEPVPCHEPDPGLAAFRACRSRTVRTCPSRASRGRSPDVRKLHHEAADHALVEFGMVPGLVAILDDVGALAGLRGNPGAEPGGRDLVAEQVAGGRRPVRPARPLSGSIPWARSPVVIALGKPQLRRKRRQFFGSHLFGDSRANAARVAVSTRRRNGRAGSLARIDRLRMLTPSTLGGRTPGRVELGAPDLTNLSPSGQGRPLR